MPDGMHHYNNMEWDFIEYALDGYFAACRDHGFAVPTIEQLEQLALDVCRLNSTEELDIAAMGSTRIVIAERLKEYIDSLESQRN